MLVATRKKIDKSWIDSEQKPIPFNLVILKNDIGKEFKGWWTGSFFDGYKKEHFSKIVAWRISNNYINF